MTNQPAEAHFSVNATPVILPTFWTHQAALWFRQAEMQFALYGITSDTTKFYHVFASIDQNAAQHLTDIIAKPPEDPNKDEILKQRLLERFQPNRYHRAAMLLNMRGNKVADSGERPSTLMSRMLTMLGDAEPNFIFVWLFLEQLPENIRYILMQKQLMDPLELVREADSLMRSQISRYQQCLDQHWRNHRINGQYFCNLDALFIRFQLKEPMKSWNFEEFCGSRKIQFSVGPPRWRGWEICVECSFFSTSPSFFWFGRLRRQKETKLSSKKPRFQQQPKNTHAHTDTNEKKEEEIQRRISRSAACVWVCGCVSELPDLRRGFLFFFL